MSYRYQFYNPMSRTPGVSVVKGLIIANAAIYLVGLVLKKVFGLSFFYLFGMVPESITTNFFLWQFLTSMFLHADFFHILFNMLGLFFFGPELEWLWGKRRFLTFYLVVGIVANIFSYLLDIHSKTIGIGASGAVLGVLGAYAALYPNREVILYIFPIKMKYLVIFLYLIPSFLGTAGLEGNQGIGHAVHIAGLLLGIAYVKLKWQALEDLRFSLSERLRLWRLRRKYRNFRVVDSEVKEMWDDLEDKINDDKRNSRIN